MITVHHIIHTTQLKEETFGQAYITVNFFECSSTTTVCQRQHFILENEDKAYNRTHVWKSMPLCYACPLKFAHVYVPFP